MHYRCFLLVAVAVAVCAALWGCGETRTRFSPGEIEAKKQELNELADSADFWFEHACYAEAEEEYEEVVKEAEEFKYYTGKDAEAEAILARARQRLDGEEMTEGLQGKIRIGGQWVLPASYYVDKARDLKMQADKTLAEKMIEIGGVIKKNPPSPGRVLESEEAQSILEIGADATPFVADWLNSNSREMRETALYLLEAMEDKEDIIFTAALAHLESDSPLIVEQSVRVLKRFPRDETTAALIPLLDGYNERLLEEVVIALCEIKSEPARMVLFDKAGSVSKLSLIRQVLLKHLYLLNDAETLKLLKNAVNEAFGDPYQAYMREVAIDSLLKMDIPGVLPIYTDILQRAGTLNRKLVVRILKRIEAASYNPAGSAVVKAFILFSDDREVAELAVDVMEKIADESSIELLISMVLAMDIRMVDMTYELDAENMFERIANIIKRVKKGDAAKGFTGMLTSYQSPETIFIAVHALGVLEEESAVPQLWNVYWSSSIPVKIAVMNALARIGSPEAMERVAAIIKSEPPRNVLEYITGNMPKVIRRQVAFETLFKKLDDAPPDTIRNLFITIAEDKKPWALPPLLLAAKGGEGCLGDEALRALASFKDEMSEEQAAALNEIIYSDLAALQKEMDIRNIKDTFGILKLHVDTAMPQFLESVKAEYWPLGYYSADALAGASLELIEKHRNEIHAIYRKLLKREDYYSALCLARCLHVSDREIKKTIKANEERGRRLLDSVPAGVALESALEDVTNKFGGEFETVGPEVSKMRYLLYRPRGLVFAVREDAASKRQSVCGIGYLEGFDENVYGAKIGGDVSNMLKIAGPPPEDPSLGIHYIEEFNAFVGHDPVKHRNIIFVINRDRNIRCVVETSDAASEKFREEFAKILDDICRGD